MIKVLIKIKEDKTEFKIKEFLNKNGKYSPSDNDVYTMSEKSIIDDINNGNDIYRTIYRTINGNKLTKIKTQMINESVNNKETLISINNDTKKDNINELPTYK